MKKYLLVLFLTAFIVPSFAFASWRNPISWFNNWSFNKKEKIQEVINTINTKPQNISEETKYSNSIEIENLKKEINELKNKNNSNFSKKEEVLKIINKTNTKPITIQQDNPVVEVSVENKISVNEQNILNAIEIYEKGLKAFNNSVNGYVDDYKDFYDKVYSNENERQKVLNGEKYIWGYFNTDLKRIKEKWTSFRDEIYSNTEDKNLRSKIISIYPQPTIEIYNKIPQLHNALIGSLGNYYSLSKLSETQDYKTFFQLYGLLNSDYNDANYVGSSPLNEMKQGLGKAMTEKYSSKIECAQFGSGNYNRGCQVYIDAIEAENKMNLLLNLL